MAKYVDYYDTVPVFLRDDHAPVFSEKMARELDIKRRALYDRMKTIIELYESMKLENSRYGLDIKLPPCDDLKNYISYLKDIDFIFFNVHFYNVKTKFLNLSL